MTQKEIENVLKYVKLKCAEQRLLCKNNWTYEPLDKGGEVDEESILNAPEPEINLSFLDDGMIVIGNLSNERVIVNEKAHEVYIKQSNSIN